MDNIVADIRNKLTLPKTVLEAVKKGKEVKKDIITKALNDLNEATRLINMIPPNFPT